jgi:hypothetical protein
MEGILSEDVNPSLGRLVESESDNYFEESSFASSGVYSVEDCNQVVSVDEKVINLLSLPLSTNGNICNNIHPLPPPSPLRCVEAL